ncbi:uncharacterized protein METZ01_LOCUS358098 [marine metagenome]|uniref:Uncharacterized protein n=1 Tax=marine metagenome TaxID=408172 RepID=A0A382S5R2_9ZZZZ
MYKFYKILSLAFGWLFKAKNQQVPFSSRIVVFN